MEKVVASFSLRLSKLNHSGMYPALLIGKWFICVQMVTYAKYSESRFWFGMKGHTSPKKFGKR